MDNKKINYEQWYQLRAQKILSKAKDRDIAPDNEHGQDNEGNSKMKGKGKGKGTGGRGRGKGKFGGRFAGRGRWGKR